MAKQVKWTPETITAHLAKLSPQERKLLLDDAKTLATEKEWQEKKAIPDKFDADEKTPLKLWDPADIMKPNADGKFRFCKQFAHFVYKHKVDKEWLEAWFTDEINGGNELKEFYVAHENGDENHPYEHTHVLVNFGRAIDKRGPRFADIEIEGDDLAEKIIVHPHIAPVHGKDHWNTLIRYLGKEDPENADLKEHGREEDEAWAETVWRMKNLSEVMLWATSRGIQPQAAKAVWETKPRAERKEKKFHPVEWQQELLTRLAEQGSNRYINWFYDKSGGCGKSATCKEILKRFPNEAIFIKGCGITTKDMARIMKNQGDKGNSLRIMVFDLPRSTAESRETISTMLECACDGTISSGKYDSDNYEFDTEHIIVFANFMPTGISVSKDRLIIHQLDWLDKHEPYDAWSRWTKACENLPTEAGARQPTPTSVVTASGSKALALLAPNIRHVVFRKPKSTSMAQARSAEPVLTDKISTLAEPSSAPLPGCLESANRPDNVADAAVSDFLDELWN